MQVLTDICVVHLDLEWQVAVSHPIPVVGTKHRSSAWAPCTPYHWAFSVARTFLWGRSVNFACFPSSVYWGSWRGEAGIFHSLLSNLHIFFLCLNPYLRQNTCKRDHFNKWFLFSWSPELWMFLSHILEILTQPFFSIHDYNALAISITCIPIPP